MLLDGPLDGDAFLAYVEQAYSPDLNPIEMAFSKLKAILRAAAERTLDGLWEAVANALDCFKPKECQNYFTAAGYNPT